MVEMCKVCGVPVQLGRHNEEIEYVERAAEGDLPMASLMLGGGCRRSVTPDVVVW